MKSLLVIAVLAVAIVACVADPVVKKINIRPGVDEEHTVEREDSVCIFSYSVTGGSSEEWTMELDDHDGDLACIITRGSPSYLYFNSFKASFGGKTITGVDVLGQDLVLRRDREYIIQQNELKSTRYYQGIVNAINIHSGQAAEYNEEL